MKSTSPKETEQIARNLAKRLKGDETICLFGDLGAGKTHFTKSLAAALGIEKKSIKSPTYTILREYKIINQKTKHLVHFDLYRLEELDDAIHEKLSECFHDKSTITIIEWPEKAIKSLPSKRIEIYMEFKFETSREIKISTFK